MEKNSAAFAIEWSIELEKALRSRNPGHDSSELHTRLSSYDVSGRCVQAIHRIGSRLKRWSREPEPTMASSRMLGLISGEDRLFANTILLRLADAFGLGDKSVRLAVVKVFRSELRNCTGKGRKGNGGLLGKATVQNQAVLLRRVKAVFDTGDAESRALALVLFGCWADFAKDSAQIRHLILSSLVSSNDLEVKASLYAAGCFCELSEDFALVALEMLVNLVSSCEISFAVRLAGVRIFAKMRSSFSIANRAYKTGLKLALDTLEEDFLVALLVSLSKLASKLFVLIPDQVELLLSFLSQERTLRLRKTAIRCMHFLLLQGVVYVPTSGHFISTLFSTLDEPKLSSALQCQVLQILQKILLHELCILPCKEMQEFTNLLITVQSASQSPILSKSFSAIHVMADISSKLMSRPEMVSHSICSSFEPMQLILLIIKQMTLLVKPFLDRDHTESQAYQYVQSLLHILLFLVGEHPNLATLVLDKANSFVGHIVNLHDSVAKQEGLLVSDIKKLREKSLIITSKLICHVYKFLVACLENLNEAGAITTEIFDKTKTLVDSVHGCILFDGYMRTYFSILLHSRIIWGCVFNGNKGNYNFDPLVEQEVLSLKFAKTLIEEDHWHAYKAGTYAACQGSWFTATFILGQLISKVQSDYCRCWLKSLAQLAHSESKLQPLLLPKEQSSSVALFEVIKTLAMHLKGDFNEIDQDRTRNINMNAPELSKTLAGAHRGICSSGEYLDTAFTSGLAFCFQKWFLALRAKVLGTAVEILEIGDQNIISNVESLKSLQQKSFRLKRLACEYDLMAISFIGMDNKSSKIISALALGCSLLAFSTGFSLFIPILPALESTESCDPENSEDCLEPVLLQNLIGRLKHIDCETGKTISLLLEVTGQLKNCLHLHSRNQFLSNGSEARLIQTICNHAISRVACLHNKATLLQNEDLLSKITSDGLQLLLDIVLKWIHIPFQIPKYFLKVRPCIGSELFASSAETSNSNSILISSGSHLPLNLCLRVKNLPSDLQPRLTKFYCILSCRSSSQTSKPSGGSEEQEEQAYKPWESDNLVEMNEKLLRYVTDCSKKINGERHRTDEDERVVVNTFTRFQVNERGEGFSSCLLDVSNFPVGCYRIRWHSCCVDDHGSYWSLLPLNTGPVFTVH